MVSLKFATTTSVTKDQCITKSLLPKFCYLVRIENWYEERLYLEQTYKKKPDLKIVSFYSAPTTDINLLFSVIVFRSAIVSQLLTISTPVDFLSPSVPSTASLNKRLLTLSVTMAS